MSRFTELRAGLRFSGFTVLMLVLVIAAALILSPSISTLVQQRREIAELRASLAASEAAVAQARSDYEKWQDPAYIRSQARDRLFYVLPGESQLGVIEDVTLTPEETVEPTVGLTSVERNWTHALLSSTLRAAYPEKNE